MSAPVPPPRPRFYRRRRFWVGSGVGVLALVLVALLAVYWLLQTVAGRNVLLAQVVARLPAGATFTWKEVDGPLAGPLTLRGVDFRYQDYRFTADRVHLDAALRPLLGRKLQLDALEVSGATLNLAKSEEPFELPRWPDSLPHIEMPLAIQADTIVVDSLRVTQLGEPLIDVRRVRGGLDLANGELRTRRLQVDTDRGNFGLNGDYVPREDYKTNFTATAVLPAPRGRTPASFRLVARGDLENMEVAIAGRAPKPLRASLVFTGRDDPRWKLRADTEALDTALLMGAAGVAEPAAATPLAFDFSAEGKGGSAALQGWVRQGEQKIVVQPSRVALKDQVITAAPLVVDAFGGQLSLRGTGDFRDADNARFRVAAYARDMRFVPAPDPATPQAQQVPVELREARFGLAGTMKQWAVYGRAEIAREQQRAELHVDARGDERACAVARSARDHARWRARPQRRGWLATDAVLGRGCAPLAVRSGLLCAGLGRPTVRADRFEGPAVAAGCQWRAGRVPGDRGNHRTARPTASARHRRARPLCVGRQPGRRRLDPGRGQQPSQCARPRR